MEVGKKDLDIEPHDIARIPAASLWELCRSYDEENGAFPEPEFSGLSLYSYFKEIMETRLYVEALEMRRVVKVEVLPYDST